MQGLVPCASSLSAGGRASRCLGRCCPPRLYRFALARLGNDPEATKEVVQVALTKATRKLHTYRGEAALFTWLCAICRNEVSSWLAKQSRYQQHIVLVEDYPEIQAAVDSLQVPSADNPERQFQRLEVVRMIQVALDRLPPIYGNILEWKYIEQVPVNEIATRLGLSPKAAESLLTRAREAFRRAFGVLDSAPEVSTRPSWWMESLT